MKIRMLPLLFKIRWIEPSLPLKFCSSCYLLLLSGIPGLRQLRKFGDNSPPIYNMSQAVVMLVEVMVMECTRILSHLNDRVVTKLLSNWTTLSSLQDPSMFWFIRSPIWSLKRNTGTWKGGPGMLGEGRGWRIRGTTVVELVAYIVLLRGKTFLVEFVLILSELFFVRTIIW